MTLFQHDQFTDIPEQSRPLLEKSLNTYGWIPNQNAVMAASPALLEAYQKANDLFLASSFNDTEKATVWIATGIAQHCDYTIKAHQFIAQKSNVNPDVIKAIVTGDALSNRLHALRELTLKMASNPSLVISDDILTFISAGFDKKQVCEVILAVAQKTMSNIMNNLAKTPIDEVFNS